MYTNKTKPQSGGDLVYVAPERNLVTTTWNFMYNNDVKGNFCPKLFYKILSYKEDALCY